MGLAPVSLGCSDGFVHITLASPGVWDPLPPAPPALDMIAGDKRVHFKEFSARKVLLFSFYYQRPQPGWLQAAWALGSLLPSPRWITCGIRWGRRQVKPPLPTTLPSSVMIWEQSWGMLSNWPLIRGSPLEDGMATHSSTLAWRIPWTEDPGGLQSMVLKRVIHDWPTKPRAAQGAYSSRGANATLGELILIKFQT